MAKKKMSMSAKIRGLLDKGLEPKKIAKRLKIAPAYVHTIKWSWANDRKVEVPAVDVPVEISTPSPIPTLNTLDMFIRDVIRDRINDMVASRIDKVLETM